MLLRQRMMPEEFLELYAANTLWIAEGEPVSQGLDGRRALF
ncbi:hypothetical protein [Roseobacter sp. A03A-229]